MNKCFIFNSSILIALLLFTSLLVSVNLNTFNLFLLLFALEILPAPLHSLKMFFHKVLCRIFEFDPTSELKLVIVY